MPKKPKKRPDGSCLEKDPEAGDAGEDAINESGYYYDDSHGYQTYKSDQDDDQFENDES